MHGRCGQLDVDLIEMMACPSGCSNGDGQLKNDSQWLAPTESTATKALPESISESKERVASVEALKGPPAMSPSPSCKSASMRCQSWRSSHRWLRSGESIAQPVAPYCLLHVTSPPLPPPPDETTLQHVRILVLRPSICSGVCSCCASLPSGLRNAHKLSLSLTLAPQRSAAVLLLLQIVNYVLNTTCFMYIGYLKDIA